MSGSSRQYFEDLFQHPTMMPKFKARVSTSAGRWKARAFSSNATIQESISALVHQKTNYEVILRDIQKLEREGHGSVAHVAGIRFLIDANHAAVSKAGAGTLAFMRSTMTRSTPADQLYKPVHRLLVEEDIYAFSWSPLLSRSYYAVMAIIHTTKLASAVVSTVGSFGAAAPALIDAIGSAASTLQDVIKLTSAVQEASSILVEGAATAIEEGSAARDHFGAASNPSASGLGSAVAAAQATDLGAHTARTDRGTVKTLLGLRSRPETDEEMRKRLGRELLEFESEVQKLNFVVVQRVTPVLQVRDNIDVTDPTKPTATFDIKTYMSNRSLVRAGETTRDKFAQLVMAWKTESFNASDAAELFCRPWAAENVYRQWKDEPDSHFRSEAGNQAFDDLNWDVDPSWILKGESTGTLPLPAGILSARIRLQERARLRAAQKVSNVLASRARAAVSQNRLDAQRRLIQASNLPSVRDFKEKTTTYSMGGLYKNARDNEKLLNIDTQLGAWFRVKQKMESIDRIIVSLNCIIVACDDYLDQKNAEAHKSGHVSQRVPAVRDLRAEAENLCQRLL